MANNKVFAVVVLVSMITACANQSNHSPTWPTNLNVIHLSDGGICLDGDSAIRLAELKAELEAM